MTRLSSKSSDIIVRAITLFYDKPVNENPKINDIKRIFLKLRRCLKEAGVHAWTYRMVFPPLSSWLKPLELRTFVKDLRMGVGSDILVEPIVVEGDSREELAKILESLVIDDLTYAGIMCKSLECLENILGILWNLGLEESTYTRIAVELGDWITTPYFPATSNYQKARGFAVALRYTEAFKEKIENNFDDLVHALSDLYNRLEKAGFCTGIEFMGIDYSLSPWMEESVAGILEKVAGSKMGGIGTVYAIRRVNKNISEIRKAVGGHSLGFNEVMLAVAEDNLLDLRVSEGSVKLRDLVLYAAFSVAGVDMVAINRESINYKLLARDLWSVYEVKGKPMGVRVILTNKPPGSSIFLKRFGKTHVVLP